MNLWNLVKESFWKLPFISEKKKDDFYYFIRALVRGQSRGTKSTEAIYQYAKQVLDNQLLNNSFSVDFPKKTRNHSDRCGCETDCLLSSSVLSRFP